MKKLLSILLITVMTLTGISFTTDIASAATMGDWAFMGTHCTSNRAAYSTINYLQAKYPHSTQYKGSGECYGWAEKVSTMLSSKRTAKYYKGLKFTKTNFLKKCQGVRAGTHLRLSNKKEFNGSGHSVVLLKVTKKEVCWTEANYGSYNNIRYVSATPEEFVRTYSSFKYLNAVIKPLGYKAQKTPLLSWVRTSDGKGKLFWTGTTSTSKYKIYRATSKNGTYNLIKTTTLTSYKDTTAKIGTKYYYKVKSIKKTGPNKTSGYVAFTTRLATPKITSITNETKSGKIKFTWKKVPNAKVYHVYRSKNGGLFNYAGYTQKTAFVDTAVANPQNDYAYKVKAVYKKDSPGNSLASQPSDWCYCRLAAPTVSATFNRENRTLKLTWNKISYADTYEIEYATSKTSKNYYWLTFTSNRSATIHLDDEFRSGKTYYVWVRATSDDFWTDSSLRSNLIKVTIP